MQPGSQVYNDRPPRRVQRRKSEATDLLTAYSDNLEEAVTKESRKLFLRTAGLYTVRSVAETTFTIAKHGVASSVSLDRVNTIPRVPSRTEPIAGLQNITCQSEPGMQRDGEENNSLGPDNSDTKRAERATKQVFGHRRT